MRRSESIKEIGKALIDFQGEVDKIAKDETNPFYKSKYAPLSTIQDAIKVPLQKCGLAVVQLPEGKNELTTMLIHTSGEWIEATYEMTPAKNDPQGIGSNITYQRRYALGAALNLNIDEDDDGNKASGKTKQEKEPRKKFSSSMANNEFLRRIASNERNARALGKEFDPIAFLDQYYQMTDEDKRYIGSIYQSYKDAEKNQKNGSASTN